jgi:hypothetical protein
MLQTCLPTCILASSTSSLSTIIYAITTRSATVLSKIQQIQKSKTNQNPQIKRKRKKDRNKTGCLLFVGRVAGL